MTQVSVSATKHKDRAILKAVGKVECRNMHCNVCYVCLLTIDDCFLCFRNRMQTLLCRRMKITYILSDRCVCTKLRPTTMIGTCKVPRRDFPKTLATAMIKPTRCVSLCTRLCLCVYSPDNFSLRPMLLCTGMA